MKGSLWLFISVIVFMAPFAQAKKDANILRGGFGFLFPDNSGFANSAQFPNAGQTALGKGSTAQVDYERINSGSVVTQDLTGSFTWGNGKFGLGAFGSRSGTKLDKSANSTDSAGGVLGLAIAKDRLTLGVGYSRSIDQGQSNDGALSGSFTLNGNKGMGPTIGVGASTTVNATKNLIAAIAGLGYAFKGSNSIEANVQLPDVNKTGNWTAAALFSLGTHAVYLAGGYNYVKTTSGFNHVAQGRLGFVPAHWFDFSVHATHTVKKGNNPLWGGSFRVLF